MPHRRGFTYDIAGATSGSYNIAVPAVYNTTSGMPLQTYWSTNSGGEATYIAASSVLTNIT